MTANILNIQLFAISCAWFKRADADLVNAIIKTCAQQHFSRYLSSKKKKGKKIDENGKGSGNSKVRCDVLMLWCYDRLMVRQLCTYRKVRQLRTGQGCHSLTAVQQLARNARDDRKVLERIFFFTSLFLISFILVFPERVAIKIMDKGKLDDKMRRMLTQEISTMEAIHHPNLIRLYEVVETYSKLYLVMEFASGGELYNKVTTCGKLEEAVARQLFAQICSGVSHMVGWFLYTFLNGRPRENWFPMQLL